MVYASHPTRLIQPTLHNFERQTYVKVETEQETTNSNTLYTKTE